MILEMFVLILSVCFFLMWYGYYTKIRAFAIVGLSIIFILSAWIVLYSYSGQDSLGLQYQTGLTVNNVDGNSVISYNYTTYNDNTTFWFGFLLAIISMTGIFLVLINDK